MRMSVDLPALDRARAGSCVLARPGPAAVPQLPDEPLAGAEPVRLQAQGQLRRLAPRRQPRRLVLVGHVLHLRRDRRRLPHPPPPPLFCGALAGRVSAAETEAPRRLPRP